jgi:hypothetical protein
MAKAPKHEECVREFPEAHPCLKTVLAHTDDDERFVAAFIETEKPPVIPRTLG